MHLPELREVISSATSRSMLPEVFLSAWPSDQHDVITLSVDLVGKIWLYSLDKFFFILMTHSENPYRQEVFLNDLRSGQSATKVISGS